MVMNLGDHASRLKHRREPRAKFRMTYRAPVAYGYATRSVSRILLRVAFAFGLAGLGAFNGCDSNTAPLPSAPASAEGSFPANNPADSLPAIDLVDQYGATVSLASLKGKPVLIDFIYTNCATACPVLTARFAQIAHKLGENLGSRVTMVSITLDPEHDHPAQLLEYAKTHEVNRDGWILLTGKPENIDALLRIYRIKREREPDGTIAHVATSFLVGGNGRQLRMYNAMEVAPDTVVGDIDRALGSS
jgi:cytochrome oxidase Cu insertion factor (SCO1/SenC/PrrC family)